MAERPTCETCPYFVDGGEFNLAIKAHIEKTTRDYDENSDHFEIHLDGQCRRFPPSFGPVSTLGKCHWAYEGYPEVMSIGWCGEHPDFPAYIQNLKDERSDSAVPQLTPFPGN